MDETTKNAAAFVVRKATEVDAEEIVEILGGIALEGGYTAISTPWSVDRQREYIASLSAREAVYVAASGRGEIVGYQTLELWARTLDSMAHVGQVGTFVRARWRGRGVGEALFRRTVGFARAHGFTKFVIQVRAGNDAAQRFYQRMGFCECGRFARQVRIGGQEEDEILMEMFL